MGNLRYEAVNMGSAHPAMTLASGVDIIEISRVKRVLERYGQRFLDRVYTAEEIAYCRGRAPNLAARFAAKEATMKALGTGGAGSELEGHRGNTPRKRCTWCSP